MAQNFNGGGTLQFPDLPDGATRTGIAHSHSIEYSRYVQRMAFWFPGDPVATPEVWVDRQSHFSYGDLQAARRNNLEYSLHTPSGALFFTTPTSARDEFTAKLGDPDNADPQRVFDGAPMPGSPSSGDVSRIVECLKAGR